MTHGIKKTPETSDRFPAVENQCAAGVLIDIGGAFCYWVAYPASCKNVLVRASPKNLLIDDGAIPSEFFIFVVLLQFGKYPRPLDVMFFLRDQPLGEVLVEPLHRLPLMPTLIVHRPLFSSWRLPVPFSLAIYFSFIM